MAAASPAAANCAKTVDEDRFAKSRRGLRSNSVIMLQAHALWPVKTAHKVAEITGYSSRAVQEWDAQRARIPADALAALLQSDWGREFLAAVMEQAEPRWWVKLKAFFRALDVMTMQRITRRKLKEALDADQYLAPSAAQMFQDEEFYSAQPAPPRQHHRAVVRGKAR